MLLRSLKPSPKGNEFQSINADVKRTRKKILMNKTVGRSQTAEPKNIYFLNVSNEHVSITQHTFSEVILYTDKHGAASEWQFVQMVGCLVPQLSTAQFVLV